ncbi:hypothetical protein C1645_815007 [Glomus cerebriforme]|uniref:Uncharacterized protein n=1 Tax=Glomus cerebriforme TaxID=658196 RepID=A0A397TEY3_9GLOM|nr:hypothetical protein C1645_815007 [Glomus cerebriforme]
MNTTNYIAQANTNIPSSQNISSQISNNYQPSCPNNNNGSNIQYPSSNDQGSDIHIATPALQNVFEFYLPLSNDTVYHVTYTKLHSFDIAQRLNCGVNASQYHQNLKQLIQQQIQKQQQQVQQPVDFIRQQYTDNVTYSSAAMPLNAQDTGNGGSDINTAPIQNNN